jgi:hypothetical protein
MNDNTKRRRGRFPHTIFVRASDVEKAAILDRAAQSRMSASRYLVRGGLEGKAPPADEERRELERLLRLFVRAHGSLTRLLADTRKLKQLGADPGIEEELQEVLAALTTLVHRMRQRLSEG